MPIYGPNGEILSMVGDPVDPLVAARQAANQATGAANTATTAANTATGAANTATSAANTATTAANTATTAANTATSAANSATTAANTATSAANTATSAANTATTAANTATTAANTATSAANTATSAANTATTAASDVTSAAAKFEATGQQLASNATKATQAATDAATAANKAAQAATDAADALKASQAAAQTSRWSQLVRLLTFSQASSRPAKIASGCGVAALAVDAVIIANFGNPGLFANKAMEWQTVLYEDLDRAWIDFRSAYDTDITGTWQGIAKGSMDAYMLRQISPAFEALKALAHQFAGSLTALSSSIEALNLDGIQAMVASAAFLVALSAIDFATGGAATGALIAAVIGYVTMLLFWLNSMVNLMNNATGQLVAITNEASRVKNAIWQDTTNRTDPSRITLPSAVTDKDNANNKYWERVPTLGTT